MEERAHLGGTEVEPLRPGGPVRAITREGRFQCRQIGREGGVDNPGGTGFSPKRYACASTRGS
jgi:hypothetical protein